MSDLHRSASRLMSRPAVSISNSGGWTFGSPSVLMMFHRAPGGLQDELAAMDECMPHYYKITNDHGRGAELIMRAEAEFMHGHLADAQIALERAYTQTEESGQMNMTLCCDFSRHAHRAANRSRPASQRERSPRTAAHASQFRMDKHPECSLRIPQRTLRRYGQYPRGIRLTYARLGLHTRAGQTDA